MPAITGAYEMRPPAGPMTATVIPGSTVSCRLLGHSDSASRVSVAAASGLTNGDKSLALQVSFRMASAAESSPFLATPFERSFRW